jgi:hypothetical protein
MQRNHDYRLRGGKLSPRGGELFPNRAELFFVGIAARFCYSTVIHYLNFGIYLATLKYGREVKI